MLIGLDPSTRVTGWAVITYPGRKIVDFGQWEIGSLRKQYRHLGKHGQLTASLIEGFEDLWRSYPNAAQVWVEDMYHGRSAKTTLVLASFAGHTAACAHVYWPEAVIEGIAPLEWRRALGLGQGATKTDVKSHMLDLGWTMGLGQDAYDAAAVAWAGWEKDQSLAEDPIHAKVVKGQKRARRERRLRRQRYGNK